MPAITKVQPKKQALAGPMRIVPEGTLGAWYVFDKFQANIVVLILCRPGDNPNQCSQGFNCGPPSVSLDSNDPFGNRYIDIGAGGPTPFTFTATSNVSWLQLSPSQGSISPDSPEQRVFVSVKNWNSISAGKSAAVISFKATPQGQPSSTVTVNVAATRNDVPSGFKGKRKPFGLEF